MELGRGLSILPDAPVGPGLETPDLSAPALTPGTSPTQRSLSSSRWGEEEGAGLSQAPEELFSHSPPQGLGGN